jgi:hypothetical protein
VKVPAGAEGQARVVAGIMTFTGSAGRRGGVRHLPRSRWPFHHGRFFSVNILNGASFIKYKTIEYFHKSAIPLAHTFSMVLPFRAPDFMPSTSTS